MKKKILATFIVSLLLCFSFAINTAVAATCSGPHSKYFNGVTNASSWSSRHEFTYPNMYDGNGKPITGWCNCDYEGIIYNVYCGVCYEKIAGPYTIIRTYNHTACGK